jgi:hypothetical protein
MNPNLISEWLVGEIEGDPTLAGIFGTRIYPDRAPDNAPNPCLIYNLIFGNPEPFCNSGLSQSGDFAIGLRAYADSRQTANAAREALRQLLDGRTRVAISEGVTAEALELNAYADDFDPGTSDYAAFANLDVSILE